MKPGPKRKPIDYELVRKLSHIQCTDAELSAVLGISEDTINRRKLDDPDFACAYKGRDEGKMSLRRAMWQTAMKGNTSLLIWLSKQHLGMKEPQHETAGESNTGTLDELVSVIDGSGNGGSHVG